jgi:hypothetical protein
MKRLNKIEHVADIGLSGGCSRGLKPELLQDLKQTSGMEVAIAVEGEKSRFGNLNAGITGSCAEECEKRNTGHRALG